MTQDDDDLEPPPEVVELPIEDSLDLHTFSPKDVKSLVPEYLDAAAARGFREVRIIHGKGTGTLRRLVHALLERHPRVAGFMLADGGGGSWGATVVTLRAVD